jgi:FimV-like protein
VVAAAGQATAMIPPPVPDGPSSDEGRIPAPVQQGTDHLDWTLQWVLLAAAVLGLLAIVAVVADVLGRRHWRRSPLDSALASTDSGELPRAAGLLGDLFVQQGHVDAAGHAYRAAIDVGDEYWSPVAQIALAQLFSDRGDREEARPLLEAVVASGHPSTASLAQAALSDLSTGQATHAGFGSPYAYETLTDPASARRS